MIRLIAHRAKDNHNYNENTLEAIEYCLSKEYIDGVEIDVRLTKDKQLVLNHNMTLYDESILIKNKTLKELKKYKIGKTKQSINTLDEVLKKIKTDKKIIIELKEENLFDDSIIKIIKKYIKKYKNLYICSFRYDLMIKINSKNCKRGLIIGYLLNRNKNTIDFDFLSYQYGEKIEIKENQELMIWGKINKNLNYNCYIITNKAYELQSIIKNTN